MTTWTWTSTSELARRWLAVGVAAVLLGGAAPPSDTAAGAVRVDAGEPASGPSPQSQSGGRYVVVACSLPHNDDGVRLAHLRVRALRAAGFSRAHVLDGDYMPRLKSFWICAVDSFAEQKQAFGLVATLKRAGIESYVAPAW